MANYEAPLAMQYLMEADFALHHNVINKLNMAHWEMIGADCHCCETVLTTAQRLSFLIQDMTDRIRRRAEKKLEALTKRLARNEKSKLHMRVVRARQKEENERRGLAGQALVAVNDPPVAAVPLVVDLPAVCDSPPEITTADILQALNEAAFKDALAAHEQHRIFDLDDFDDDGVKLPVLTFTSDATSSDGSTAASPPSKRRTRGTSTTASPPSKRRTRCASSSSGASSLDGESSPPLAERSVGN